MIGILNRLHRDPGGQGTAFAALTLFALVAFLASTVNLGAVLEARIRHQGAADAAAYSAAVVRAQGLSAVAAMNHVLVWLARAAAALVFAVISLGVLVALNAVFPGAFAWAIPLFQRAVSAAVEWLPKLRAWARRVAAAQDRLVRLVPLLAAGEAERIARANGDAHALALPPAAALPVSRERNPARFLDRVTGGAVPAWASGWLLGKGGSFSQSHSRQVEEGRTRSSTKTDRDLGQGVEDAATRGKLAAFKRILRDLAKDPWPMPLILDRRYADESLTVASFPSRGAFRAPIWPEAFPTPRGYPFVATARPFHPGLPRPGAEDARDNLYLVDGWAAELTPLDLKALRALRLDAGVDVGVRTGKERLPWLEH